MLQSMYGFHIEIDMFKVTEKCSKLRFLQGFQMFNAYIFSPIDV